VISTVYITVMGVVCNTFEYRIDKEKYTAVCNSC